MQSQVNTITDFLSTISWSKISKMKHFGNFLYLSTELEEKEYDTNHPCTNFNYVTITAKNKLYYGSSTNDVPFMSKDYTGSTVTNKIEFENDKALGYRTICVAVSDNKVEMLKLERRVLNTVDAAGSENYYNASNSAGSAVLKYSNDLEYFESIKNSILNEEFPVYEVEYDEVYKLDRKQCRDHDIDSSHVKDIRLDVKESNGDFLDDVKPTIVLGGCEKKGIPDKRYGNTHTLEAGQDKSVNSIYRSKKWKKIVIPYETWSKLNDRMLRDLGLWDNRLEIKISRKTNSKDEILESLLSHCLTYNISHTDQKTKNYAKNNFGIMGSDWEPIRKKLRVALAEAKSDSMLASDMERIIYTDTKLKDHVDEKNEASTITEFMCLSTVFSGGKFNGWDPIIRWLNDSKRTKTHLHIDFYHGEKSFKKYEDTWLDGKAKDIISQIEKLFEGYGMKGAFSYDTLPTTQQRQNG